MLASGESVSERPENTEPTRAEVDIRRTAYAASGRLLAAVGHEMRTPLTAMAGLVEFLARPDVSAAEARQYAQAVHCNTQTLLQLSDHLRALADFEAVSLQGRVLLAEHQLDVRVALRVHLETAGLEVEAVEDGLTAVERALSAVRRGQAHHLILMDWDLPKLPGEAAVRLLRASDWQGPVLAVTRDAASAGRESYGESGFDGCVVHPISRGVLLATVQRALELDRHVVAARGETGRDAGIELATGFGSGDGLVDPDGEFLPFDAGAGEVGGTANTGYGAGFPRETVEIFQARLPLLVARLEQHLRDRQLREAVQHAQQLAVAGALGFSALADAAGKLATRAAAGAHVRELLRLFETVRAAAAVPGDSAAPVGQNRYRVLVADDDELTRAGLALLVNGLAPFQVVAQAVNGREVVQQAERHRPEIVLMDIAMPELDGLNAAAQLKTRVPHSRVVLVAAAAREETVTQAMQAGVAGYVLRSTSVAELERALLAVARGDTYFCAAAVRYLVAQGLNHARVRNKLIKQLTPRQLEVLKRIAEGNSSKMIAHHLGISIRTAEHHRTNLMHSLGLHDTASLVRYAVQIGLIEPTG